VIDISVLIAIAGLLLAVVTFVVGRNTAAKSDGKQDGQILTELGYLKSNTDDIKRRLDDQDRRYTEMLVTVTGLERDMKTAYMRIDELKGALKS
jgi:hypothetical protein